MPEATASVPPDSDPPASFTLDSADSKCQPAQIVRHISLTQLEALHAVPLDTGTVFGGPTGTILGAATGAVVGGGAGAAAGKVKEHLK